MKNFADVNEVLDFAMNSEQQAVDFYNSLAARATNEDMKQIFLSYAKEEMGHKAKLSKIKKEGILEGDTPKINDLKIADYTAPVKASPDMDYQDALVLAMRREKAAFKLYTDLAERVSDGDLQKVFYNLAQEEAKHKLRFELEYDEFVLRDN